MSVRELPKAGRKKPRGRSTWHNPWSSDRPGVVVQRPMTQNENLMTHEALGRIHKEEIKHELKASRLTT